MFYNLKEIREKYGLSVNEMASLIELNSLFYQKYENTSNIPSKYVYKLWLKLDNLPIPNDFFHYTSYVLEVNMKYHNMTQKQIAAMFDIANQSTISGYMKDNIPMYEKKDYFHKFNPFIVPVIVDTTEESINYKAITNLSPRGNFILVEKRRKKKMEKNTNS